MTHLDGRREACTGRIAADEWDYPDNLDARLLRIAGVCLLAVMMTIVDTTVVAVAQHTFITAFGSTQAVVAWTMTGYTLAMATVIPAAGWAADRFGTKRLFLASVLSFTGGSLLCVVAPNMMLLIGFRVFQGFGGGMLTPLAYTVLTREAGANRLGRLIAVLGIPMLLGPIAGPVLSGWLIDNYGWQWIFVLNLPLGVTAFVLAALLFPKDRATRSEAFDIIGMLLLSPGLATFLYGISTIPKRGTVTDLQVWVPGAIGLALIGGFVLHALYRTDHPLIDLRLFKNREVTAANSAILLSAAAFFGVGLLLPSCLQQLLHQTPLQSGVHIVPERLGALVTMPIAGVFMDKRGPRSVVMVGITLIAAGMSIFGYGIATHGDYLPALLAGLTIMGMGMGCSTMLLSAAAVQALAPEQIARGSALVNVNQQVAISLGSALMSVILTSQINYDEKLDAAGKIVNLHENAGFTSALTHDLSHAYTMVLVAGVILLALTYIPAAFLPRKAAVVGTGLTSDIRDAVR
ncbi:MULTISPECIES: DHA2 family efflux MFS transporter permease subunit [Mycobacterium]|uniref:DHA2 family efflux MFS transporter permease subunit n=1 Tax=Mycobacterium TaxID=1763 RepID=UPI0020103843|nr:MULTISPECIES: DHA2 family efflux MFS transporter permease subunit [Mycobacterium]UQB93129.1 DHA2 family efflux MFS transporter permease subunit [Mycobacterium intracellulare]WSE46154.1 DHA2 family efflux MFS transporter permease subunit [Mycobacterium sp. 3-98]